MNTARVRVDVAVRSAVCILFIGLFCWAYFYFAAASVAITAARRGSGLLAGISQSNMSSGGAAQSQGVVRRALLAAPLSQGLVNAAMIEDEDRGGRLSEWLSLLRSMGWRDTPAVQNIIWDAAQHQQLSVAMDGLDALLRRGQLTTQASTAMRAAELDPSSRLLLARKLIARPSWRHDYLATSYDLQAVDAGIARFLLIAEMQRAGDKVERSEVAGLTSRLVQLGRPDLAFRLWASVAKIARPVNDGTLREAATMSRATSDNLSPFEWSIISAEGAEVNAQIDRGISELSIQWDGRGVPIFARQTTSVVAGSSYRLKIAASPESAGDLSAIGFRLVCKGEVIEFHAVSQVGANTEMRADRPTACSFARLEIYGKIADQSKDRSISLRYIQLQAT